MTTYISGSSDTKELLKLSWEFCWIDTSDAQCFDYSTYLKKKKKKKPDFTKGENPTFITASWVAPPEFQWWENFLLKNISSRKCMIEL